MRMKHSQKVKMARRGLSRVERKKVKLFHPFGKGFSVMRLFHSKNWMVRKEARARKAAK